VWQIRLLWEIATVAIANGRRERRLASSVSWLQSNGSDPLDKERQFYAGARVLSVGLLTGAMLLIGVSIVGFWKSLTPSEFVSWFASHSSRVGVIMVPLGTITLLLSLAAVVVSWRSRLKQRQRVMIAALCAVCVMASYPVFFAGANASFVAGVLPDSAVRALLERWAVWHWGRTFLGLLGFVAAVLALQSSGR
jgi:hypothetical protein